MTAVRHRREPRYWSKRWTRVRRVVLARDGYRCWVDGCPRPGVVADHIEPAHPGMPDHRFYDVTNLRASCQRHNLARGIAAWFDADTAGTVEPTRMTTYGSPRLTSIGSSTGEDVNEAASPKTHASPATIFGRRAG